MSQPQSESADTVGSGTASELKSESLPLNARPGVVAAILPSLVLVVTFAMLFWYRINQPGDLYDADQPKTISYSVDMILNHQWAMPRDILLEPATKPPLYNWLGLPILFIYKTWDPWQFKAVSVVAALVTCALVLLAARRLINPHTVGLGVVAVGILLCSRSFMRLMYFSRPDMLLTAFLTGAWLFGTLAITRKIGSTRVLAAMFWICVGGAALTKGPPAMVPVIYVALAAWLIEGDWRTLKRLHWMMAIWFVLLPLAAWGGMGILQGGKRFLQVMENEVRTRVVGGGPEGQDRKPTWLMPVWFFANFQPFATLVLVALLAIPVWRWAKHPIGPAILWMVVVLGLFSLPGSKRQDYLLPMYPPAAIVAAFVLLAAGSAIGLTVFRATLVILVFAYFTASFPERQSVFSSDNVEAFAVKIRPIVGKDSIVVVGVGGYQPLLPMLGRLEGMVPRSRNLTQYWQDKLRREINAAQWVVMPVDEELQAEATGGEVYMGNAKPLPLGLYRIGGDKHPTRDQLIAQIPPLRVAPSATTQSGGREERAQPDFNPVEPAP